MKQFVHTIILTIVCFSSYAASPLTISSGKWEISVNEKNGNVRLRFDHGEPFDALRHFKDDEKEYATFQLDKVSFDSNKRMLELKLRLKDWEITEFWTFDANGVEGLLKRSADILLSKNHRNEERFHCYAPISWFHSAMDYYIPGTIFGQPFLMPHNGGMPSNNSGIYSDRSTGNTSKITQKERIRESFTGAHTLFLKDKEKNLFMFLADDRWDPMLYYLIPLKKGFQVKQRIGAAGWAWPGEKQTGIGDCYLFIRPNTTFAEGLEFDMPRFYQACGITAPKDRPAWAEEAIVYEVAPFQGSEASGRTKFIKDDLVPRIRELGFNTVYLQPIQSSVHHYLPLFYKKLSTRVGTEQEYMDLVAEIQKHGMHVWQDIVPHGSNQQSIKARGGSALDLCFRQDGSVSRSNYPTDYLNPKHQEQMRSAAEFYMELGPDGFRIDMPYGSDYNWAKPGLPGLQTKTNIDPEWWRKSLEEAGGIMPRIKYQRASLPNRMGGFSMVEIIRNEAKKVNRDGAVLSELLSPMHGSVSDVIYDLCYEYLTSLYRNMTPADFARELKRYFFEKEKLSPPGTRYLRVFQSHDSMPNFGFLGTAAGRAAYASCVLSKGIPILDYGMDSGHGAFLKKIHTVRAENKQLSHGEIYYNGIDFSAPEVWSVLHEWDGKYAFALINFSSRETNGKISLSGTPAKTAKNLAGPWHDAMSGRNYDSFTSDIKLPPFGIAVLIPGSVETSLPKSHSVQEYGGKVSLSENKEYITVKAAAYELQLNKKTGLISNMKNRSGKTILSNCDLIFARKTELQETSVSITSEKGNPMITFRRNAGSGSWNISYHCTPDRLNISTSLEKNPGGEFAGLYFPASEAASYRISTAEGLLDDFFQTNLTPRTENPYQSLPRIYRDRANILYDSESRPLNWTLPLTAHYNKNGKGVEFELADAFTDAPANILLYRQNGTAQKPGWFWAYRTASVLSAGFPEKFRFSIRPADRAHDLPESPASVKIGKLNLSSESFDYVIQSQSGTLRLRRTGELKECRMNEKIQLSGNELTLSGLGKFKPSRASADGMAGCVIRKNGDVLYFRFLNRFIGLHRNTIWAIREYSIDSKGEIAGAVHILPDDPAKYTVEWSMNCSNPEIIKTLPSNVFKDGKLRIPFIRNDKLSRPDQWQSMKFTILTDLEKADSLLPDLKIFTEKVKSIPPDPSWEIHGAAFSVNENEMVPNSLPSQIPGLTAIEYGLEGNQAFDRKESAEGKVSVRLSGLKIDSRQRRFGSLAAITRWNDLEKGNYLVSFKMKTENLCPDAEVKFYVYGLRKNGSFVRKEFPVKQPKRTSPWQTYKVPVELGMDLELVHIEIRQSDEWGGGCCWIDDVRVQKKGFSKIMEDISTIVRNKK